MTIKEIKSAVDELSNEAITLNDEDAIEDALASLDELVEYLEALEQELEYDGEYQDILESIEDTKHLLTENLDSLYDEEDDEY